MWQMRNNTAAHKHTAQNDTSSTAATMPLTMTCTAHALLSGSHGLLTTAPPTVYRPYTTFRETDCTDAWCGCGCVTKQPHPAAGCSLHICTFAEKAGTAASRWLSGWTTLCGTAAAWLRHSQHCLAPSLAEWWFGWHTAPQREDPSDADTQSHTAPARAPILLQLRSARSTRMHMPKLTTSAQHSLVGMAPAAKGCSLPSRWTCSCGLLPQ